MKITIGSEGMGIWGEKYLTYVLKIMNYTDIEYKNINDCDLIISSWALNQEGRWNKKKKKYIYWTGEPLLPEESENHTKGLHLSTTIENKLKYHIYLPFFLYSPHLNKERKYTNQNRKYLLAYCSNRPVEERESMFNLFVKKKGKELCHSFGSCTGKYPETKQNFIPGYWNGMDLIDTYKDYTFVIAMENRIKSGYITEKIINAFYSGAIPIYWGSTNINEFFNPKAFINVNNFSSFKECVKYVCNMSKEDIKNMTEEKIYNENNDLVNLYISDPSKNETLKQHIEVLKEFLE